MFTFLSWINVICTPLIAFTVIPDVWAVEPVGSIAVAAWAAMWFFDNLYDAMGWAK